MAWFRIDDNAPFHRKQLKAGPAACWLWVCGLAYSQRLATDGYIPDEALPCLGVVSWKRLTTFLVDAELWNRATGGYQIHDFCEFHETRDERGRFQENRKDRNARYYQRIKTDRKTSESGNLRRLNPTPSDALKPPPSDGEPEPEPEPEPRKTPIAPTGHGERFERFWRAYPKKKAKHAAWTWWQRHKPDEALTLEMIEAIEAQQRTPQWTRDGGQFIPHPKTWLNSGSWTDEVLDLDAAADAELERFRPKGA